MRLFATALCGLVFSACSSGSKLDPVGRSDLAITGGVAAPGDNSIVAVMVDPTANATLCSGVLIAPDLVLTARHCLSTPSAADCTGTFAAPISASKVFWTNEATIGTTLQPVKAISVPTGSSLCGDDIAVLVLKDPVPSSSATPLAPRLDAPVSAGELVTAFGYGSSDSTGNGSGVRRKRDGVKVTCAGACGPTTGDSEWTSDAGPCMGDGPGVGSDGLVAGMASRGAPDCSQSTWEGLVPHADWLRSTAAAAAQAGGYPAPAWAGGATDAGTGGAGGATDAGTGGAGGVTGDAGGAPSGGGSVATGGKGTGGHATSSNSDSSGGCSLAPSRETSAAWLLLASVLACAATLRARRAALSM